MINNTSYNLISNPKEKDILLAKLVQIKSEVLLKIEGKGSPIVKYQPLSLLDSLKILFKTEGRKLNLEFTEVGVIQFNIEDKKIMAQVDLSSRGEGLLLCYFCYDLYIVQRRDFFRLRLPFDFQAYVELPPALGKLRFKIDDISAGGLQLLDSREVTTFKLNQSFLINLEVPGHDLQTQKVIVRRVQKGKPYKIGLQFLDVTKEDQSELLSLVMQLYRRFHQSS